MGYGITLMLGTVLLLKALFNLRKSLVFLRTSEKATGTVIEIKQVEIVDWDYRNPVFQFSTGRNQHFLYELEGSGRVPSWRIGDTATIIYNPKNPADARVLSEFQLFATAKGWLIPALPMVVVGGGYYLTQALLQ